MILQNNENNNVVINLQQVTRINETKDYYMIFFVSNYELIKKDDNSKKIFDYFAAKTKSEMENINIMQDKLNKVMSESQNILAAFAKQQKQ